MAWVGYYWLGLTGIGLVCVASTLWLRSKWRIPNGFLEFDADQLQRVWIMPMAVYVETSTERCWMFRDEIGPAQWAALLRALHAYVPRQAVGFNISR